MDEIREQAAEATGQALMSEDLSALNTRTRNAFGLADDCNPATDLSDAMMLLFTAPAYRIEREAVGDFVSVRVGDGSCRVEVSGAETLPELICQAMLKAVY